MATDPELGVIIGFLATPQGDLYVGDLSNNRIVQLNRDRRTWLQLGKRGEGPGEFFVPQAIATTPKGNLVVYDPGQQRLSVFGPDRKLRTASQLDVVLTHVKGMLADDNFVYLSATSATGPGASFVVHKLKLNGEYVLSFGAASQEFPNTTERLAADAGPLIWGREQRSIVLSRGGTRLELTEFNLDGSPLSRVLPGEPFFKEWSKRSRMASQGERLAITSLPLLGTVAAFVLEDSLLVNLAALDDSSLVRYDVLTLRPLRWLASWTEQTPRGQRFGASNRRNTVYSISPREATITERTVSIRTP